MIKKSESKIRRKQNQNISIRQDNVDHQSEEKSFISIPCIPGASERLKGIFGKYGVKVAHKPTRKLRLELCHLKDKRATYEESGVVYGVDCKDCDAKCVG